MSSVVQMVAVHACNKSGRGKPEFFLPYEAARDLVDARMAKWNKKGTFINLLKVTAEMHKSARSLKPNQQTMDDYCEGKPYAIAIIESYKFKLAA